MSRENKLGYVVDASLLTARMFKGAYSRHTIGCCSWMHHEAGKVPTTRMHMGQLVHTTQSSLPSRWAVASEGTGSLQLGSSGGPDAVKN